MKSELFVRRKVRIRFLGSILVLLFCPCAKLAAAPIIFPSEAIYVELIRFGPDVIQAQERGGSSATLPESISAEGGTVSMTDAPFIFAEVIQPTVVEGFVSAGGTINFDVQLFKLHPDAGGGLAIPVNMTAFASATIEPPLSGLSSGAGVNFGVDSICGTDARTAPGPCDGTLTIVFSTDDVVAPAVRSATVSATASVRDRDGLAQAQISGPVFEIDPTTMVPFFDGTMRRAVDLYTLGTESGAQNAIRFESNLNVPTSGCLNDPSIFRSNGTPSLSSGDTVTCRGRDPSGYLAGGFDDLDVQVLDGARVESPEEDRQAMALDGSNNSLTNAGIIESENAGADAVDMLALNSDQGPELLNVATIRTTADASDAVSMVGHGSMLDNAESGLIETVGESSDAVVITGDEVTVENDGIIRTHGDDSAGITVEPIPSALGGTTDFASQSSVTNRGLIETMGNDASGIDVIGDDSTIDNQLGAGIIAAGDLSLGITVAGDVSQLVNAGSVTMRGEQSAAMAGGGNHLSATNTGNLEVLGPQSAGIGMLGADSNVMLGAGSSINVSGNNSLGVAAAGDGDLVSFTLSRGEGATVDVDPGSTMTLSGNSSTGFLLFHDNGRFSGFGTLNGTGADTVGLAFVGDLLDVNANGNLILDGNSSTGVVFGADHPMTSGTSKDGSLTLGGIFTLLGNQSIGVDAEGIRHTITNNATIETAASGIGVNVSGDNSTTTNAVGAKIVKGGVVLTGDNITFANAGDISGKGVKFETGTGHVDAINTGNITLGNPTEFDAGVLPGFQLITGGGKITNEGTIQGNIDQSTVGIAVQGLSEALTIANTDGAVIEVQTGITAAVDRDVTVENLGSITGQGGVGIVSSAKASMINDRTGELTITKPNRGQGTLPDALGVDIFAEGGASFVNNGEVTVIVSEPQDTAAVALRVSGGLQNATDAELINHGTIEIQGAAAVSGAKLIGPTTQATNERNATISAQSGGSSEFFAISMAAATKATARNDGELVAMGDNSRGISALATTPDTDFNIINSGRIEVSGSGAIGLRLQSQGNLDPTGESIPAMRVLGNEDTLLVTGANGRGMRIDPLISSTRLENAGRLDVSGDNSIGIEITASHENFVLNANGFAVAGEKAIGISVTGDNNTIMNGQDAAVFPEGPLIGPQGRYAGDTPGLTNVVDAFIALADSELGNIPVQGSLVVQGKDAIGINIAGNNNRIANVRGFGRGPTLPPLGVGTPILAEGFNAIGVAMQGPGNLFLNEGTVRGDFVAIQDGPFGNTVINGGSVFGDINLGAGDDTLVVREGAELQGMARGGVGHDRLIAAMLNFLPGQPVNPYVLDANRYLSFDTFDKAGDNTLIVDGRLAVRTARIRRGETRLADGAEITGDVILSPGSLLSGNGTVGSLTLFDGARGSPGQSPGHWDVLGDLAVVGGILEFEIAGIDVFDTIFVGGSTVFQGGTIEVSVIDSFVPSVDDTFELLLSDSISGLEAVNFQFNGLAFGLGLAIDLSTPGSLAFRTTARAPSVTEPTSLILVIIGSLLFLAQRPSTSIKSQ